MSHYEQLYIDWPIYLHWANNPIPPTPMHSTTGYCTAVNQLCVLFIPPCYTNSQNNGITTLKGYKSGLYEKLRVKYAKPVWALRFISKLTVFCPFDVSGTLVSLNICVNSCGHVITSMQILAKSGFCGKYVIIIP